MLLRPPGRTLEQQLSLAVVAGLLVFAVVAGLMTAVFAYRYQLDAARDLQRQLVATVRAQAEVAVFAVNEDIAREVVDGLKANPLIRAVRVTARKSQLVMATGGPDEAFRLTEERTSFPLLSPVDRRTEIGNIDVVLDYGQVTAQALVATRLLLGIVGLQVILAAVLLVWVSRRVVVAPIASLARRMARVVPGSGIRLEIPEHHAADEIGQLSHSANVLIDAHEAALAELRELATVDGLTGTYNRRHFLVRMEDELARLQRKEGLHAVLLMLDIDHFKRINDTWGHAAGDTALSQLGVILRSNARKIDAVGRMGGEEFAILLVGTDLTEALSFSERLRQTVADTPVAHEGKLIEMTMSIGLTVVTATDRNPTAVLGRADAALYQAKQQGRNRVVLADQATAPDA